MRVVLRTSAMYIMLTIQILQVDIDTQKETPKFIVLTSMQPTHPPSMTLSDMQTRWDTILQEFTVSHHDRAWVCILTHDIKEPEEHLSAILYAVGHDQPEIVTVPYRCSLLYLEHWLSEPCLVNFYTSCSGTDIIGIRRKTFKHFPTSRGVLLSHTYTVLYWTQNLQMPVNHALQGYCAAAQKYRLLHDNVLVLKHRQSSFDAYEDMTREDVGLVGSVIGRCGPCRHVVHVGLMCIWKCCFCWFSWLHRWTWLCTWCHQVVDTCNCYCL